ATVRAEAAVARVRIEGEVPGPALPILRAAAQNRAFLGRWRVIEALGRAGASAIPVLVAALGEEEFARLPAAEALGRIGPDAKEAVPALVRALGSPQWPIRARAALALWKVDRQSERVLPILIDALRAPALAPRRGRASAPLLPGQHTQVRSFKTDSNRSVYLSTTYPAGVSQFVPVVDLRALRREMVEALGEMGPQAEAAVPVLAKIAAADDDPARSQAAEARKRIDPPAEDEPGAR
ncbi:MAG: HEAT repeat domain-containing protein, partial [Acidimicrobiia bacterium]|nr:HEAT repeat domain-containing protein [Acidimicrobiia bacterium]